MTVDGPAVPGESEVDPTGPGTSRFVRNGVSGGAARLSEVRKELKFWAVAQGLTADDVDDLVLASYEALANAFEHAYGDEPPRADVSAVRRADGRVEVTVRDHGRWRPAPDEAGFRGRGLVMIRTLPHRAEIEPGPDGTVIRMSWWLPRSSS